MVCTVAFSFCSIAKWAQCFVDIHRSIARFGARKGHFEGKAGGEGGRREDQVGRWEGDRGGKEKRKCSQEQLGDTKKFTEDLYEKLKASEARVKRLHKDIGQLREAHDKVGKGRGRRKEW